MLIGRTADIPGSEITAENTYFNRRALLKAAGLTAVGGLLPAIGRSADLQVPALDEPLTPEPIVTGFNNFYEFGPDKDDPARYAHRLTTSPWTVRIGGEAEVTGDFDFEDVIRGFTVEERVYRFRCVEAWSMVVPWRGIPLAKVLAKFKPTSQAKYVEFTTLYRPDEMPGQKTVFSSIDWPYVEGLRMDEAMHPLTLMATGVYGKDLPNQNGAPWRLVVPWKYGFKNIKSIVSIRFSRRQPVNSWQRTAPGEYGFYANVNPAVSHPRWSQSRERRLPSTLANPNWRETLPFNGYGEQVAALYSDMNLSRYY